MDKIVRGTLIKLQRHLAVAFGFEGSEFRVGLFYMRAPVVELLGMGVLDSGQWCRIFL